MRFIGTGLLAAGLALPAAYETKQGKSAAEPQKTEQRVEEKREKKSRARSVFKKTRRGLLSAVIFLAEPAE